jgi:hypothetical protein
MADMSIGTFKTPSVHEMTRDEYREQRRRVLASLAKAKDDTRAVPSLAPPTVES